jgi:sister-chromatid-cohesion protein PDS5
VRLKAVSLLGRLFALPGRHVAQEYRQLFSEFLKRFSDKAIEVRLAVIECAKACLEANPTGPEAADILGGYNVLFSKNDFQVDVLNMNVLHLFS